MTTADGRQAKGFLSVAQVADSVGQTNTVLDLHSLLVSQGVIIGKGNVFYPGVVIERSGDGMVTIGDDNVFYPGVYILSSAGAVRIGNGNEFGTGGCTIKANMAGAAVTIGHGGRYADGANIMGQTSLGDGSQVLGAIMVQSCVLAGGGTFSEPNPDKRGAVLKGFGLARGLQLETGQVVNGAGSFADAPIERQRKYHPQAPSGPGAAAV